uniref:Uncharacterized protein n=1 Tax=Meloidogyne enterolobii TaxID=390850 RepID=A0A6V7XQY5_MELEN|nr:unnamed protein product [Meloidogyne enterolobii]
MFGGRTKVVLVILLIARKSLKGTKNGCLTSLKDFNSDSEVWE